MSFENYSSFENYNNFIDYQFFRKIVKLRIDIIQNVKHWSISIISLSGLDGLHSYVDKSS